VPSSSQPKYSAESLRLKLSQETIRANLIRSGLFLAGWEMLKMQVLDQVRSFFVSIVDGKTTDYETHVLVRHKSRFEASLLWLVEMEALTVQQAERVRDLRDYRNQIAHELPRMLVEPDHDVDLSRIRELKHLNDIVGRFWCRTELSVNPDFDDNTVADEDMQSGIMMLMDHLLASAEGQCAEF
jgi:hypothetical protein